MSTVVQLFIMKNGALEGSEMVSGDRFIVGSDASCAVVLEDPSIQARHLGVFVHDGRLAVQDLTGGQVRVNGETFTGARYIGAREDVALGAYTIKLKLMSGSGSTKSSGPVPTSPAPSAPAPAPAPAPVAVAASIAAPVPPKPAPASAPVAVKPAPAPKPMPLAAAAPAPAPSPQKSVAARGHGVTLGNANLEVTQAAPPPVPPATDPPLLASLSTDDDRTAVDPASRTAPSKKSSPPSSPSPSPSPSPSRPLANLGARESGPLTFTPHWDDDEEHDEEEDLPWSLVQRLVRPPEGTSGKNPVIEVVHYRGEHVVDHQVLGDGGSFTLGAGWTKAERAERGLEKPIALVRMKKDGVAEILQSSGVQGKLLRSGVQADLPSAGATPLVDGELCSLRVGNERVFVRFAGVPALLWSKEDLAEVQRERKIQTASGGAAMAFFAFFIFVSWIYGYRSKSEDIINLEDDGFAEIIEKDLNFEEPPKPEKPPEPVKTKEPVPEKQPEPKATPTAKVEPTPDPNPPKEAPKAGLAAALENIPKVNDSASNQNLNAALSNIKGVRVPGDASGFKTSALTGKGPSSGVQIGGAAGGLATSGINSLIRKDGAAGALGGKGDRSVAGKVTTQPRLSQVKNNGGSLTKEQIQRVINAHVGEIQYCYEKQLRTNAGLAGRVVLEWAVSSSGAVSVVKVSTSSLSSTEATNCMMGQVKKWKFPKPDGNGSVTVVYPFVFNTI